MAKSSKDNSKEFNLQALQIVNQRDIHNCPVPSISMTASPSETLSNLANILLSWESFCKYSIVICVASGCFLGFGVQTVCL